MTSAIEDLLSTTVETLKAAMHCYTTVKDDNSLRRAFHGAGERLRYVVQVLEAAKAHIARHGLDGDLEEPQNLLQVCSTKVKQSQGIFQMVARAPQTSRLPFYKAAVKQLGNGQVVEDLVKGMMIDVCVFAENNAIRGMMRNEVAVLRNAIETLSNMEPSLSTERSGDNYNNWSAGDMLNAPRGKVTKNNFSGATFSGTVSF
ncbi:hypothetical protein VFPPC_03743 [Pochonia chlamydosporia 170]|uniref:NACHT-NTPase and P-loop NTPases N-terminal domain-containing protein n=1 Tax=Pochonia chlamydosporia 170 TaxID=1380566 RepID=A0A179G0N9_METCM|nr:hypothetical protein VFPPC_03743 [Pochonia chlamydosporia 170]OAQ71445.1 hypothetical protein VFPPC_03743 [Pochonia chlamydosporia 170]